MTMSAPGGSAAMKLTVIDTGDPLASGSASTAFNNSATVQPPKTPITAS